MRLTQITPPVVTQAGTLASGSPVIAGLSDTSAMVAGAVVTGTGIPFATLILTVDSATQITLNNNATVSGSQTLTVGIEPLTLAVVKNYLKVDFTDDDFLIANLIISARRYCETQLRQALITQTWELLLDSFPSAGGYYNRAIREIWPNLGGLPSGIGFYPGLIPNSTGVINIPMPPLQSITSVQYKDFSGTIQTLSSTQYNVSTGVPARIQPVYSHVWPISQPVIDSVQITFVAGYGANAAAMPPNVQTALMLMVSHWYEHRLPVAEGSWAEVPMAVDALLSASDHGSYA